MLTVSLSSRMTVVPALPPLDRTWPFAPPPRRLGGELTSVDTSQRRACPSAVRVAGNAAQRHKLSKLNRFLYHRQREAAVAAQIQSAESPQNPGWFTLHLALLGWTSELSL